jgi:hypothetical protein
VVKIPLSHKVRRVVRSRQRGAVIKRVATLLGLVYFGSLDHNDEHEVIRGVTVSTSHRDTHSVIGSYDGYDVSIVDRDDIIKHDTMAAHRRWAIIQVRLKHTPIAGAIMLLPHDTRHHYAHAFSGLRHMQPIDGLVDVPYSQEFLRRYSLLAPSHQAPDVNHLMTPALADLAALKLWPHAVELKDTTLLVYITEDRLSETVLRVAIESALWLADSLDQSAS